MSLVPNVYKYMKKETREWLQSQEMPDECIDNLVEVEWGSVSNVIIDGIYPMADPLDEPIMNIRRNYDKD